MEEGASIVEINRLRARLSAVKGGRLGRATRARLVTLVLSDVPGDQPGLVGSGPTIRGRRGDIVRVVARNKDGLEAAARRAREIGLSPRIRKRRLTGSALVQGARFGSEAISLRRGEVLLAGGETTVAFSNEPRGTGGRCLVFAAGASFRLAGREGLVMLAAGSDGIDGSSKAAGAFVDGSTRRRASANRILEAWGRNDTAPLFWSLGDLFAPGPTGTNVGDWVFVLREKP
jgi:hydroxypyruvate reductase